MRANKRAFFKRGGAACAAAAVLIGGTFTAGTASATPSPDSPSSATSTVTADSALAEGDLPGGLAEAVKRDLDMTLAEFTARADSATQAADASADPTNEASPDSATSASAPEASTPPANKAPLAATTDAASIDALFAAYAGEFGVRNLQSIMVNGSGNYVIRTGEAANGGPAVASRSFTAAATTPLDNFAARYSNVVIATANGPAAPLAIDVTNGQGYAAVNSESERGGFCSIGWNGFDGAGKPAVISAGHCTFDGFTDVAVLTDPTTEPAVAPEGTQVLPLENLGNFGFSQFGGPGNTPLTVPTAWDGDYNTLDNIGTDISVINDITPSLNQLAKVTDWTTPAAPENSGPKVKGVSTAIVGAPICKSGRTTGWKCGTVTELGVFLVRGTTFPADEKDCDPEQTPVITDPGCDDLRAVRGFGSTDLVADRGDSGGAIISGELAVGMVSAGDPGKITYGVDLKDALQRTAGYSVKISLNKPTVTISAPLYRNGTVTGTVAEAPAGTTVSVTIDGTTTDVPVGADGTWSIKAPNKFGTFPVTAQTKNGFSSSETTEASLEVIKETLAAPVITAPANNSKVAAPVTIISGTGKPGASLVLSGDVTGSTVVGADGTWSFTLTDAVTEVGSYSVTAKATLLDWIDSPTTTTKFTVVPVAPAIISPANGATFAYNEGPTVISGTNLKQAKVSVTLNGKKYNAVVVDGTWSLTLDTKLTSGSYTMTVEQQLGGVDSLTSTSTFVVQAEPAPPVTQEPTPAPTTTAPTTAPGTTAPGPNDLAATGANKPLLIGGAGGLLLLGGATFLLLRRRSSH